MQLQSNRPALGSSLAETLRSRRQRLAEQVSFPVVLWSGGSHARNYPGNPYPFRASSHFLYFAGQPLPNTAIRLERGNLELFMDNPTPADILWHGESVQREQVAEQIGADAAYPLSQLGAAVEGAATIPVMDAATRRQQSQLLHRTLMPTDALQDHDRQLAEAIIQLRLIHDALAIAELQTAAAITVEAHRAGMAATLTARTEAEIRAAMEGVVIAHDTVCAYTSIVTVHGEVLHSNHYHHPIQPGDLLLADMAAESRSGWASDVTRTWPTSGRFSATQRDIYEIVLAAHDRCIAEARPGVEYRDLHNLAATVIATGLSDLGILRGRPEDLVEMNAHALFFPHGVGHLLGLDVHDMEDLGDLAGYAPGRSRSQRFGLCYLRLDRPLQAGMAFTIEPGFYQVPAILHDPEQRQTYRDVINWDRLEQFSDVRGIRIEDDILITDTGNVVLTAALPNQAAAVEQLVRSFE